MERVFIIHGLDSSPNKAWRPWLMAELNKKGVYACALPMPLGKDAFCDEWVETIYKAVGDDHNVYLIGHSLGSRAVLKYLEQMEGDPIKGAVLVSARFGKPQSGILGSFYDNSLDFKKIKASSENFIAIHGDDDPNIPYEDGKKIAENLGCELVTIPGGGHLSGKAGWKELPEALDALLKMMNK